MPYLLIGLYAVLFAWLATKNFRLATGLFIISLPTYLIRFNIGPLPTTLLELEFGLLFLIWLVKYAKTDWLNIKAIFLSNRLLLIAYSLLLIASVASIFVSDMWWYSAGQWRAYFLEPMLLFVMLTGRTTPASTTVILSPQGEESLKLNNVKGSFANAQDDKMSQSGISAIDLVWFLLLSTANISIVAIVQKLFGGPYAPSLWNDETFGRAMSFFTTPNAVGLYLAPILMLGLGVIASEAKRSVAIPLISNRPTLNKGITTSAFGLLVMMMLLAVLAIIFSQSVGTIVALAAGLLIFAFIAGYKKTAIVGILIALVLLSLPLTQNILIAKSKSLNNRLVLWSHTKTFLTASPKNFILGAGIRQYFRKVEKPFYNPVELERLIYPHNIFLNFWTETGLLGMLAFVGLFYSLLSTSYSFRNTNKLLAASLLACLTVIIIHGQVDAPYFKNDLAILFWVIAAIIIASARPDFNYIKNNNTDAPLRRE